MCVRACVRITIGHQHHWIIISHFWLGGQSPPWLPWLPPFPKRSLPQDQRAEGNTHLILATKWTVQRAPWRHRVSGVSKVSERVVDNASLELHMLPQVTGFEQIWNMTWSSKVEALTKLSPYVSLTKCSFALRYAADHMPASFRLFQEMNYQLSAPRFHMVLHVSDSLGQFTDRFHFNRYFPQQAEIIIWFWSLICLNSFIIFWGPGSSPGLSNTLSALILVPIHWFPKSVSPVLPLVFIFIHTLSTGKSTRICYRLEHIGLHQWITRCLPTTCECRACWIALPTCPGPQICITCQCRNEFTHDVDMIFVQVYIVFMTFFPLWYDLINKYWWHVLGHAGWMVESLILCRLWLFSNLEVMDQRLGNPPERRKQKMGYCRWKLWISINQVVFVTSEDLQFLLVPFYFCLLHRFSNFNGPTFRPIPGELVVEGL